MRKTQIYVQRKKKDLKKKNKNESKKTIEQ